MHMWAERNGRVEKPLSALDKHVMQQGQEVEKLAREFLQEYLREQNPNLEIQFQSTLVDGSYEARIDALVFDPEEEVYDLYEIKSSTSVKTEHKWDVAFQAMVVEASINLRNCFLVLVNKEYVRDGEINVSQLFVIEPAGEYVEKVWDDVAAAREKALQVATKASAEGIEPCHKPGDCICPSLCHPDLPDYPVYDIPSLYKKKVNELRAKGILSLDDLPDHYPLTDRQKPYVRAAKQRRPLVNLGGIRAELAKLEYPLYFLDYEAYNPALPIFDGFHPYQWITFQYSLHVIQSPGEDMQHFEFLATEGQDPSTELAASLQEVIGNKGTVLVWHKTFESGRNQDLAELVPESKAFFDDLNSRIYDLKDIFSKGYYIHPDFHGSASIKKVLPVLAGEVDQSYDQLQISSGDQAMMAWLELTTGLLGEAQIEETKSNLLEYCKLDTLAMVVSWQFVAGLVT